MSDPAAPERVPSAAPAGPPPPKKSAVPCLIIGLCLGVGGIFVIGVLAALLLPAIAKATERARVTACASNLRQLWTLQSVYAAQFGGREKEFPTETGAAFWLKLSQTTPPLVDSSGRDVYLCPVRGAESATCDYLGPARPVKTLQSSDPVGADRAGNHKDGGNVIRKDGSVVELLKVEFSAVSGRLSP